MGLGSGANGQAESVNAAPAHMGAADCATRLNRAGPINDLLTSSLPARFIVPHFAQARMPAPVDTKPQWSHPLHVVPVPALADNYIWLLYDDAGDAIVVDPGEAAPIEAALDRRGLRLRAILLTHHHNDHIGGVADLLARGPVPVYAPRDERIGHVTQVVADGDEVTIAQPSARFRVLEIPGHTRSHIAYVGAGMLLCGDTLFSMGCGRLFEGTPQQMLASLDRLLRRTESLLRARIHRRQRTLRADGGTGQCRAGAARRTGPRAARTGTADAAGGARHRAGDQSLPACRQPRRGAMVHAPRCRCRPRFPLRRPARRQG